jgi:hypothetical protein
MKSVYNTILKSLQNSSTNTSQTGCRVLNECQRYSAGGKIDSAILAEFSDVNVNELVKHLKTKNFTEVRKWVVANLDNDVSSLLRRVYDASYD